MKVRVVAALTSFNRRDKTLAALAALAQAAHVAQVQLSAVLVDDASTDGTADAVRSAHPWAQVVVGPGDLFWNRGMHRALALAQQQAADHVLWLNDDTLLHADGLAHLLAQAASLQQRLGRPLILVGSTADARGRVTYGGRAASGRWRRFNFERVWSASQALPCQVMNGNCVLVPMPLAREMGNLDPAFEHAMGDTDYALRACAAGHPVWVASGLVARCELNPTAGGFNDRSLSLRQRWRAMQHRKGLPWRSWLHFTRRHGGWLWPIYFVWPYARLLASGLLRTR